MKLLQHTVDGIRNTLLRSSTEQLKPKWLWFGVTDMCNSHCTHCNIWQKKPTEHPLTSSEIEKALRDPLFKGLECILNAGGEPVIRNDIEEILLIEHKIFPNAYLHLSTNSLLPERVIQVVKTMIKNDIPLEIGISLDGIGQKHDLIRGIDDNFAKAEWLLTELISMRDKGNTNIAPIIGFTLSHLTMDSFEEVKTYAEKRRVPFLAQWYNETSFYDNVGKNLNGRTAGKEKMLKIVCSLPCNLLNEKWMNWLKCKSIKFQCFAMYTFCVLKCNGDIVPCLTLWESEAGNIRENTPTQIWHSSDAKRARKLVKRCQGCLNSWGVFWSVNSCVYPYLFFYLRHTTWKVLFNKLINKLKKTILNSF